MLRYLNKNELIIDINEININISLNIDTLNENLKNLRKINVNKNEKINEIITLKFKGNQHSILIYFILKDEELKIFIDDNDIIYSENKKIDEFYNEIMLDLYVILNKAIEENNELLDNFRFSLLLIDFKKIYSNENAENLACSYYESKKFITLHDAGWGHFTFPNKTELWFGWCINTVEKFLEVSEIFLTKDFDEIKIECDDEPTFNEIIVHSNNNIEFKQYDDYEGNLLSSGLFINIAADFFHIGLFNIFSSTQQAYDFYRFEPDALSLEDFDNKVEKLLIKYEEKRNNSLMKFKKNN